MVPREAMMTEVEETLSRMAARRIWPATPLELAHALLSLIVLRQRIFVQDVARRVAALEASGISRSLTNPETNLAAWGGVVSPYR